MVTNRTSVYNTELHCHEESFEESFQDPCIQAYLACSVSRTETKGTESSYHLFERCYMKRYKAAACKVRTRYFAMPLPTVVHK